MLEDDNSPAFRAGVDFRGTANATERISEHVKPGRKRAPFLRYIRINLPRTTRLLLLLVVAVIGAASAAVALGDHEPFPFATPILWAVVGAVLARLSSESSLGDDSQYVASRENEQLFAAVLHLGAPVLGIDDTVADLDVERNPVALVVDSAGADA